MPNLRTPFLLGAGVLLGLGLASVSRPTAAEAGGTGCSVPKTNGALRAVTAAGWFVFEDSDGTVRVVDSVCKVKSVIGRQ
jgi:hypothetical protein